MERLNERTRLTAEATGLPVIHSTTLISHTGTFGNQLAGAVRATFALGYERVIVIGNDCPALTTVHLVQAAVALQTAPVVLGPDCRGGLYLLGLSRAAFDGVSLAALPWQTSQLAQAANRLYAGESVRLSARLSDVNSRGDLLHYQAITPDITLLIASLLAVESSKTARPVYAARPVGLSGSTRSLRGPPTACARLTAA